MSWKGRLQERALIRLASYGHTFLAMTEWYRRGLVEELGVRSHQTRVWRQPIDTERFYPPSARPDEPFRIVFIGGDFKRKGGDLLLEVATSSEFAKIQFDFVTEYLGNDTGNVRFHNGIKPQSEELLSLLGKSHLFVLPTRADCSSNAALEAMSTGLPAVLGDVGGSSELLVEGESGALMRTWNRDAIAEMIRPYVQDRNMLLSHGVAARARVVERHSITVHTSELARILSDRA
jgi:glycosyltransferase involved in cell wall biosynthesis